jgi:hypothetical protein
VQYGASDDEFDENEDEDEDDDEDLDDDAIVVIDDGCG